MRGSSSREVRRTTGQGGIASLLQPRAARAWVRLLRPRVYSAVGPGTECAAVERERQRVSGGRLQSQPPTAPSYRTPRRRCAPVQRIKNTSNSPLILKAFHHNADRCRLRRCRLKCEPAQVQTQMHYRAVVQTKHCNHKHNVPALSPHYMRDIVCDNYSPRGVVSSQNNSTTKKQTKNINHSLSFSNTGRSRSINIRR